MWRILFLRPAMFTWRNQPLLGTSTSGPRYGGHIHSLRFYHRIHLAILKIGSFWALEISSLLTLLYWNWKGDRFICILRKLSYFTLVNLTVLHFYLDRYRTWAIILLIFSRQSTERRCSKQRLHCRGLTITNTCRYFFFVLI